MMHPITAPSGYVSYVISLYSFHHSPLLHSSPTRQSLVPAFPSEISSLPLFYPPIFYPSCDCLFNISPIFYSIPSPPSPLHRIPTIFPGYFPHSVITHPLDLGFNHVIRRYPNRHFRYHLSPVDPTRQDTLLALSLPALLYSRY